MKAKTVFFCTECGSESPRWSGRCTVCGAWNSMVEQAAERPSKNSKMSRVKAPVKVSRITDMQADEEIRFSTGMGELDRVLGGGAVKGSLVLVGGAPGIGKSTLMLQICQQLGKFAKVLYVSGEESTRQLKLRAERPRVDSENFYELEVKDYQINDGLCDVDIPLTFGSNLLIVYNDSIKDLQKDLEDLVIISFKKAVVTLTAASTIPLKMTLNADDVDIKDKAGRPIENIKVSIGEGKETVNPSTDGTTEAESEVEIILESDNAFDTLSRIDRICFKLKADSKESSGVPLKDTQWIQVKKSALQVPGGVNIDLN